MLSQKTLKSLEYNKIAESIAGSAVLGCSKKEICGFIPISDLVDAEFLLNQTEEAFKLLYVYNIQKIYFFEDVGEQLQRVDMGGTINISDILKVTENLKSARLIKNAVNSVNDDNIVIITELVSGLYVNQDFEKEISQKIISDDEISDNASPKLASIRKEIRTINAKIRDKLNSYMRGENSKYLQEGVVTMRGDRYVIPVKSEYRSFVKGFIHDQSSSGATVFIEPEAVIEYNNDLKRALFNEKEEIFKILAEISNKISYMSEGIRKNAEILTKIDVAFAKAEYSFINKCVKPKLNNSGNVKIVQGRHPLIDKNKVIPVDVKVGKEYNFLLITGPNTGGKTVTLKLLGLLSLMAASGIFIPCDEGEMSVFSGIYTDIGDEQSIEQNLSTFSSHLMNLIDILKNIDNKSLVLIDEIGAGTDPDEGSALALAIIEKLLEKNCFGIITTHYAKLKEFAAGNLNIENASMEFDAVSLKPLYKLNIGIPGSSNAIEIAKTLGLEQAVVNRAYLYLTDNSIEFEKVIKKAESTRREAEKLKEELCEIKEQENEKLKLIEEEKEKIVKEREKITNSARREVKRIVAERLTEAEDILSELKDIAKQSELRDKDIFHAGELKNKLKNNKYLQDDLMEQPFMLIPAENDEILKGNIAYVKSLGGNAEILSVKSNKKEAEVLLGNARIVVKTSDLFNIKKPKIERQKVTINKKTDFGTVVTEINVIGKTALEALTEVKNFIDQAVVHNLEEVKIIHGVGEGVLLKEIREYLQKDKSIKSFRKGQYGEGENGVTIVTLK